MYNGTAVAVKVFLSEESDVTGEIAVMSAVNGLDNIIPFIGVVVEQQDRYKQPQVAIVTKYMVNGSLYDVVVNRNSPSYRYFVRWNRLVCANTTACVCVLC